MLTRSTPASRRSRAASIVRSIRIERGGSISTETTKRPSRSFGEELGRRRRLAGRRPAVGGAASTNDGRDRRGRRGRRGRAVASRPALAAGRAARVERGPHRGRCAPASCRSSRRRSRPRRPASAATIAPKYSGPARVDELALDPLGQAGVRDDRAGRGRRRRAGPNALERLEAGVRPGAAVDADHVDRRRLEGRRGRRRRRPVGQLELLAERQLGDDRQVGRSPAAPRRPRASRCRRSTNVSIMNRSTPPSSRPSICSRNAARIARLVEVEQLARRCAERADRAGDEGVAAGDVAGLAGDLRGAARLKRAASRRPGRTPRAGSGSRRTSRSR